MSTETITDYQQAAMTLRQSGLRQGLYDEGAVLMDGVLVNLDGEKHRSRRSVENKVFRRGFFQHYEKEIFPATLKAPIEEFISAGGGDLVEFGFRSLMNLTCDFAGIDRPKGTKDETDRLLSLMRIFALGTTLAHSRDDRRVVRKQVRDALSNFDQEFLQPSKEHRSSLIRKLKMLELDEDALPKDVLTALLLNKDRIELKKQVLIREMAFFVVAGAQTSIHSLVHLFHEIFSWSVDNPHDGKKLKSDRMLLQRCVHESVRLHPSSPIARRRAESSLILANNKTVKSGELVTIDLLNANRDKKIFGSDADKFNPHRQTNKNSSPYGLSFGIGMHACIGRTLAVGVTPKPESNPEDHHYGTITMIASALLKHGVRPDPEKKPEIDAKTARPNWGYYPVILENIES